MELINNKVYPLLGAIVDNKNKWINGVLEDFGDFMDVRIFGENAHCITSIVNISLKPNGPDSAYFTIHGKDFDCGFDVEYGGISSGELGWITFSGFQGHSFRIRAFLS